ncbi:hypothetical protein M422DRAFT_24069 [Sphaerobolus stellatus SS14]|nr:hypothetical protein M422DRAFT_24069 [Sphaerobolus stellatus SS14]
MSDSEIYCCFCSGPLENATDTWQTLVFCWETSLQGNPPFPEPKITVTKEDGQFWADFVCVGPRWEGYVSPPGKMYDPTAHPGCISFPDGSQRLSDESGPFVIHRGCLSFLCRRINASPQQIWDSLYLPGSDYLHYSSFHPTLLYCLRYLEMDGRNGVKFGYHIPAVEEWKECIDEWYDRPSMVDLNWILARPTVFPAVPTILNSIVPPVASIPSRAPCMKVFDIPELLDLILDHIICWDVCQSQFVEEMKIAYPLIIVSPDNYIAESGEEEEGEGEEDAGEEDEESILATVGEIANDAKEEYNHDKEAVSGETEVVNIEKEGFETVDGKEEVINNEDSKEVVNNGRKVPNKEEDVPNGEKNVPNSEEDEEEVPSDEVEAVNNEVEVGPDEEQKVSPAYVPPSIDQATRSIFSLLQVNRELYTAIVSDRQDIFLRLAWQHGWMLPATPEDWSNWPNGTFHNGTIFQVEKGQDWRAYFLTFLRKEDAHVRNRWRFHRMAWQFANGRKMIVEDEDPQISLEWSVGELGVRTQAAPLKAWSWEERPRNTNSQN